MVPALTMLGLLMAPTAPASQGGFDLLQLLLQATGAVRLVLFVLVLLSIIGWYVIGYKAFYLQRAHSESARFLDGFWQARRLDQVFQEADQYPRSPIAHMFKAGYVELSKIQTQKQKGDGGSFHEGGELENVERALRRAATSESTVLENMIPFLATVGSAAPFIGLFGTVVGVINAFQKIGQNGSANLATVAPGIAEALGTTAVSLVAAVPAVMAYNYFARRIKIMLGEMDAFTNDYLNIVKRHFLR